MPGFKESPLHEEQAAIDHVVEVVARMMRQRYATSQPMRRGQHAKAHGTVHATVRIASDLPSELRHGVFKTPKTYDAWLRFSASSMAPASDAERDPCGLAIKLLGVEGPKVLDDPGDRTSQDFVFVNGPQFFVRDAVDYALFADGAVRAEAAVLRLGKLATLRPLAELVRLWALRRFFAPSLWPGAWRWREFGVLQALKRRRVHDPLTERYWSQTPYRLGPYAVKYLIKPRPAAEPALENALGDGLAAAVGPRETAFDLLVQRQSDERRMPVGDPTVRWSETISPPVKVATIEIPQQDCADPVRRAFAERLRFTPWHALLEHEPLGSINRVRRAVYLESARMRDEANGVPDRTAEVPPGP
jgi:hypothetical protein